MSNLFEKAGLLLVSVSIAGLLGEEQTQAYVPTLEAAGDAIADVESDRTAAVGLPAGLATPTPPETFAVQFAGNVDGALASSRAPTSTSPQLVVQNITPAADGTNTRVTEQGRRTNISGGTLSEDGANLFHSFEEFGLGTGEIANFLSNDQIRNIISRVVGGDASYIDGLLRVSGGDSNLFLLNPAGILLGTNARLDLPGSFTATTASGIGFGDRWLNAIGRNDYSSLVGNPDAFAFSNSQPGSVFNGGNLAVSEGQNLFLIGGTVINTGTLTAPGGNITIAAVPGESWVRISQEGRLLSLDLEAIGRRGLGNGNRGLVPFTPLSLPALLTGGNITSATGVTVESDGSVQLTGSGIAISPQPGTAIASGTLNTSRRSPTPNPQFPPPQVNILGDRVAILNANLNASGNGGGGTVRIGGDIGGRDTLPAASRTLVDENSTFRADALGGGNGGRVIVWADDTTAFYGEISARGGDRTGNGGFAEVSGRQSLIFDGTADLTAADGRLGTLLLDPRDILINDLGPNSPGVDATLPDIFDDEFVGEPITISRTALEGLPATANVVLEATNNININVFGDFVFADGPGGSIRLEADSDGNGTGQFSAANNIIARGRDITISGAGVGLNDIETNSLTSGDSGSISITATAGNIVGANLTTSGTTAGGAITLNAANTIQIGDLNTSSTGNAGAVSLTTANTLETGSITSTGLAGSGNQTLTAGEIDFNGVIQGSGELILQPTDPAQDVAIAGAADSAALDLTAADLGFLQPGFSSITIGRTNGSGTVSLNPFTFNAPVAIAGGSTLIGASQNTTWQLIGANQGTISGFANGLSFSNIENLQGGSGTDIFQFADTSFEGAIDGGGGTNRLDYSAIATSLTLDLEAIQPENIQEIVAGSGTNTLVGQNLANTWTVTGTNSGTLNGATFSGFQILRGGTLNDSFRLNGGRVDQIDGAAGSNTLIGDNTTNTWQLTGTDIGSVNDAVEFSNIDNLTGGNAADTFVFSDGATLSGIIDGAAGFDTLDYSDYTAPVTVNFDQNQATGTAGVFNTEGAILPPEPPEPPGEPPVIPDIDPLPLPPDVNVAENVEPPGVYPTNPVLTDILRQDIADALDSGNLSDAVTLIEQLYSQEFQQYLGLQETPSLTLSEIQSRLAELAVQTGRTPALVYLFSRAEQLDVILVTAADAPIYRSVAAADRDSLLQVTTALRRELTDRTKLRSTSYLPAAQQLQTWTMAPIQSNLQVAEVDTLLFSVDAGLRSTPLAVLQDGEQFLIEQYSLSLIPSFSLTDTRYSSIAQAQVLAMGASEFTDFPPLPAVPVELAAIAGRPTLIPNPPEDSNNSDSNREPTQGTVIYDNNIITGTVVPSSASSPAPVGLAVPLNGLWQGRSFLNQAFTLDTLSRQQQQQPFEIIHLATHAEFRPGAPSNSFIQLWDTQLRLDQLSQLGWRNPTVELVVLSACRTALGDVEAELGFAGFAVQTGAKSAMASLWSVSDEGTLALMQEFYRQLRTTPIKAEALQQAQLAMLRGEVRIVNGQIQYPEGVLPLPPELAESNNVNLTHPYFWSGFTLVGSPW
ncbi:CHAT domain-containing protein [Cyanobacteria bacterium FACHB-471]|nr:CHAT domain-containing protein [Cyanobacteria bacterium FACHB-471]